jgi:hypothetical protein
MHDAIRTPLALSVLTLAALVAQPGAALAAPQDCAIDYDGDTLRTVNDFLVFTALFNAGSSDADLNGDQVLDAFDGNTFIAYFGFAVCPWRVDYQYDRSISTVDFVFFQTLYGAGSLRADLDGDGSVTPADFIQFGGVFGSTY